MTGLVLVDSNVLVLLIVGGTSRSYVAAHKNTKDRFDGDDFDLLTMLLRDFSEIVLVPHIVAETSSLVRQIGEPDGARYSVFLRVLYRRLTRSRSRAPMASRGARAWIWA